MNKRGISAVVATVLIILITVAGVTIVWTAIIPMIKNNMGFNELDGRVEIVTSGGYTVYDAESGIAIVQVKRGFDDSNMSGVRIIFSINGSSYGSSVVAPKPGETRVYAFNLSGYGRPDSVSVAPIFVVGKLEKEGSVTSDVDISSGKIYDVDDFVYELEEDYRISCLEGMAYINKLGGFCIDKYEASMPSANSTDMGNSTEVANRNAPGTMQAESKKGVVPWVSISQINSRIACSNAGKHLCTDEEWLAAANMQGAVYNLPTDLAVAPYGCVTGWSTYCTDHSYEDGEACNTGYNKNGESGCYSSEGVWDMTGNVWEWTNETVNTDKPCNAASNGWCYPSDSGFQTVADAKYGNDGVYFLAGSQVDRAVRRGGRWDYGAYAGPFCAHLRYGPTDTFYDRGFRCCSS